MRAKVGAGVTYNVTTGGKYLEERPGRAFLAVQNNGTVGATAVLVGHGALPSGNGLSVLGGARYQPENVPGDAIFLVAQSGTISVTVFEG